MENLSIAFPSKTEIEKLKIAKSFYKNFCDTIVETLKFSSAGENFFRKRFNSDFALMNQFQKAGTSLQINLGHNFNWELGTAVPLYTGYKILYVYKPLRNKIFDCWFYKMRTRFGAHLVAKSAIRNALLANRGLQYLLVLVADQSPHKIKNCYWVNFFGRPTAFYKGPEKAARANNFPVLFYHITKIKRGYYKTNEFLATETPKALPEGTLTKMYAEFLEKVMTEHPEMWLWSHRRWKHEWKPEYGQVVN
jgi:KDO2-lipid IV(A) lauroyltransferase